MEKKSIWTKIKDYAKSHIFHFIVLLAITTLGVVQYGQFVLAWHIYNRIDHTKQETINFINNKDKILRFEMKNLSKWQISEIEKVNNKIKRLDDEVNSRIDILDSAIKPDKKRKMLIAKVRDAITENTDTKLTIRELNNIAIAVIDYSWQYNLSIAKVLAQMRIESNFEIKAKSRKRADGLLQIIPETWEYVVLKEFDGRNLNKHNIYHNIKVGCFYMSEQVHHFDTYDQALMAYNWGPHNVRKLLDGVISENEIPKETKNYVKYINKYIKIFERYGLE